MGRGTTEDRDVRGLLGFEMIEGLGVRDSTTVVRGMPCDVVDSNSSDQA